MTAPSGGHRDLAARWTAMTLAEQMTNIGSEVERTLRARAGGQASRLNHALPRALELFDLTASDDRWRGARRREILRTREDFCGVVLADDPAAADGRRLSAYFLAFAVLARRHVSNGQVP